ncbi:MAG: hypothetical protein P9M06_06120 [Candidatus Saelkia tenebricola]|nr:hypothetical protein [Candidatus Saelkia tenebricola]
METSLFIAKIIGPCCIIVSIGIMLHRKFFQKIMEDYFKNSALVFFGGIFALIIGFVIVLTHNVWTNSWPVIITIYGWCGILKGIWLIVFPNSVLKFTQLYAKNTTFLLIQAIIIIVFGLILTHLGYFAYS